MFGTGAHAGSFAEDDPFGDLLSYVEENTNVPYTGLGLEDNAEASGVSIRTEDIDLTEMTDEQIEALVRKQMAERWPDTMTPARRGGARRAGSRRGGSGHGRLHGGDV